jgi:phosphoglycerate kinase
MTKYKTLDNLDVKNKTVIVRVDFNSEIDPANKKVTSDVRIKAHAESTLKELAEKGAKTVVLAHQGRKGDPDYTPLKEHALILGKILKCPVKYVPDLLGDKAKAAIKSLKGGEILILENVRSWDGETKSSTPEQASKTELVQKHTGGMSV